MGTWLSMLSCFPPLLVLHVFCNCLGFIQDRAPEMSIIIIIILAFSPVSCQAGRWECSSRPRLSQNQTPSLAVPVSVRLNTSAALTFYGLSSFFFFFRVTCFLSTRVLCLLFSVKPSRNEKFLAAVATGRWVLHKSYLIACASEGRFVRVRDWWMLLNVESFLFFTLAFWCSVFFSHSSVFFLLCFLWFFFWCSCWPN